MSAEHDFHAMSERLDKRQAPDVQIDDADAIRLLKAMGLPTREPQSVSLSLAESAGVILLVATCFVGMVAIAFGALEFVLWALTWTTPGGGQ